MNVEHKLLRKTRKMSVDNFHKQDTRLIRSKAKQLVDTENHYLHVVVTSKKDDCSEAELNDVKRVNQTLASCAKHFKTAFIQYQSKDDEDLRNELI